MLILNAGGLQIRPSGESCCQVNNTEKKDSNSSVWERFIRFINSL